MSVQNNYLSAKEYFEYFENLIKKYEIRNEFPLIVKEISTICDQLKSFISIISPENFFDIHAQIMGIDAKLQLYKFFLEESNDNSMTEDLIIKIVNDDYRSYFSEMVGFTQIDPIPNSLFFSVL